MSGSVSLRQVRLNEFRPAKAKAIDEQYGTTSGFPLHGAWIAVTDQKDLQRSC